MRLNMKQKRYVRGPALRGRLLRKQVRCWRPLPSSLPPDTEPALGPQKSGENEDDVQTRLAADEAVQRTGTAGCQQPMSTETPAEVFQALEQLGHQAFRPGQERVIMQILSGELGCCGDGPGPRPGPRAALLTIGPTRHVHAAGVAHWCRQVPVLSASRAALRPAEPLPHTGRLSPPVSHG